MYPEALDIEEIAPGLSKSISIAGHGRIYPFLSKPKSQQKTLKGMVKGTMNMLDRYVGTVFLSSKDVSGKKNDANFFVRLYDQLVEEVGDKHAVQFIKDNTTACVSVGSKLMDKKKHLIWTPVCCTQHRSYVRRDRRDQNCEGDSKGSKVCVKIYV
ncbi:hypothetical protein AMTR_s00013p00247680 [Amborella trichopoda]|uniref:DUF659 domain-containing protein n=1 Tax=Amborella trichopoda TaxID=13333 RepID=W1PPN8_AMBTC|nr:hypothetical protein AMTR_s00013p00247680 [Amborella trichopoda]